MTNLLFAFLPIFGSIALVTVLSRLSINAADEGRSARETGNDQLEFAPNRRNFVAVGFLVAFLTYTGASFAASNFSSNAALVLGAVWLAIALVILAVFPGSIRVSDEGLQQVYWLWKSKRIAWKDVSGIAIDEKREKVTISSRTGAKIVHARQLPDRARLLAEFAKHCGDKLPKEFGQKAPASLSDWLQPQIEVGSR